MNTHTEKHEGLKVMENCVKWSQLVTTLVAITVALSGVFSWMFNIHSSRPHKDAATVQQIEQIRTELSSDRENVTKTRETIAGMNAKLDNIQKDLDVVKKVIIKR